MRLSIIKATQADDPKVCCPAGEHVNADSIRVRKAEKKVKKARKKLKKELKKVKIDLNSSETKCAGLESKLATAEAERDDFQRQCEAFDLALTETMRGPDGYIHLEEKGDKPDDKICKQK